MVRATRGASAFAYASRLRTAYIRLTDCAWTLVGGHYLANQPKGTGDASRLTDRASAAGARVRGTPSGCLLHRLLLGGQIERCCGARQVQALVRRRVRATAWAKATSLR